MKSEAEIQRWLETLAGKYGYTHDGGLYGAVQFGNSQLDMEMKGEVTKKSRLPLMRHRAIHDACRVLSSLIEPEFVSANMNISDKLGSVLRADLVLRDVISAAFIIVEIKRNAQAARQAVTELLAYACSLRLQNPGAQFFLVVVSTSWRPLERFAFEQLAHWRIPVLPLQYVDHTDGPHLLVRSDLLPDVSDRQFSPSALRADTKVFFLPPKWRTAHAVSAWANRLDHTVRALAREAEHSGSSGFVISWHEPSTPIEANGAVHITMVVRNSYRFKDIKEFATDLEAVESAADQAYLEDQEDFDFPWANIETELSDDTATRLLLELVDIDPARGGDSPESEGTWMQLLDRLESLNAEILDFESFGDIGDQVTNWRMQERNTLAPLINDFTMLPQWHPLTWLPAVESLLDYREHDGNDESAWKAYRCGADLGKFIKFNRNGWHNPRHFGRSTSQARFVRTLSHFAKLFPDITQRLQIVPNHNEFGCSAKFLDPAFEDVHKCISEKGEVASFCFVLGYQRWAKTAEVGYLASLRNSLRDKGMSLPNEINEMVNQLSAGVELFNPRF